MVAMNEHTLCPKCGGTLSPAQPESSARRQSFPVCSCSPVSTVGRLDENYTVYLEGARGAGVILIYKGTTQAIIRPKQALSLLVWLKQEETKLRQLAEKEPS